MVLFSIVIEAQNFFLVNLDGDLKREKISWEPYAQTALGTYYQLKVYDDNGALIWKGPRTENPDNPYFVAEIDFGISIPELAEDIDKDGHLELLIPEPQSDVSPTRYHRLKWKKGGFIPMKAASLAYERNGALGQVVWVDHFPRPYGAWVSLLKPASKGKAVGEIIVLTEGENLPPQTGEVLIEWRRGGGMVIAWPKPLKYVEY
jgi:hypothetical protein